MILELEPYCEIQISANRKKIVWDIYQVNIIIECVQWYVILRNDYSESELTYPLNFLKWKDTWQRSIESVNVTTNYIGTDSSKYMYYDLNNFQDEATDC